MTTTSSNVGADQPRRDDARPLHTHLQENTMTSKKYALALSASLTLAACTTPADASTPIGAGKGNDANVAVTQAA